MKGLLRGIGYFLLYMVFTIAIQVVLSIVIVQIAAGMGIAGQTQTAQEYLRSVENFERFVAG